MGDEISTAEFSSDSMNTFMNKKKKLKKSESVAFRGTLVSLWIGWPSTRSSKELEDQKRFKKQF